jgi:hypothetical protein
MKKALLMVLFSCVVAMTALPHAAYAASPEADKKEAKKKAKAATPPKEQPPLPKIETAPSPVASSTLFPSLPQAMPCQQEDMRGLWKLSAVYEDPQGPEVTSFAASPNQYVFYRADNVFGRFNAGHTEMSTKAILENIKKHTSGLMQYLLQGDTGFIYFYNDGVATDVQACFIVTTNRIPFEKGDMLLMPPKGQIQGRLVKVYRAVRARERPAEAENAKARPKGRKK